MWSSLEPQGLISILHWGYLFIMGSTVTLSIENSYFEVLTPNIWEYDLIWREGLYRGNKVKTKPLEYTLIWLCPYKKWVCRQRDTCWGKLMWRDTGRRWPPMSQGERPGTAPFLTALRRNQPSRHLDFLPPELWNNKFLLGFPGGFTAGRW